eukprot:g3034.t1
MKKDIPKYCYENALRALEKLHGPSEYIKVVKKENESVVPVLVSLWRTMLSQNTTDKNAHEAYRRFLKRYGDDDGNIVWKLVRDAPNAEVEDAVRCAGLSKRRVENLKGILERLEQETQDLSLEFLRDMPSSEIKSYLTSFKGVGEKTASCVLLFNLKRAEFPVDVHVWRITREILGWAPTKFTRNQVYAKLNLEIPDAIKLPLHLLLVKHGKHCPRCCARKGRPQFESSGTCPLVSASEEMKRIGKQEKNPGKRKGSQALIKKEKSAKKKKR